MGCCVYCYHNPFGQGITVRQQLKRTLEYFVDRAFDAPEEGAVADVNFGFADGSEIDWISRWVD